VSRDDHKWKAVVDTVKKLRSMGGGCVDVLNKYQLVNRGSTLWSYKLCLIYNFIFTD